MLELVWFTTVTLGFLVTAILTGYESYRANRLENESPLYANSPVPPADAAVATGTGIVVPGGGPGRFTSSPSVGGGGRGSVSGGGNDNTPPRAKGRTDSTDNKSVRLEEGTYWSNGRIFTRRGNGGDKLASGGRGEVEDVRSVSTTASSTAESRGGRNATVGASGSGSRGDETRIMFYRLLTLALLSRLVLLPYEACIFASPKITCLDTPVCIMTRTIPDLTFASAFSLLVLFYAQLAGLARAGGPRGLSHILSRRGLFLYGNVGAYSMYFILLFAVFISIVPLVTFQMIVYVLLCVLYGTLLFIMGYFSPVLVSLLRPSLRKSSSSGLAMRLISMCLLCTVVFLSRTICFALAFYFKTGRYTHGLIPYLIVPPPKHPVTDMNDGGIDGGHGRLRGKIDITHVPFAEYSDPNFFVRDLMGYTLLELLPSLAILLMMHQSRSGQLSRRARDSTDAAGGDYANGNVVGGGNLSNATGLAYQSNSTEARPLLAPMLNSDRGLHGSERAVQHQFQRQHSSGIGGYGGLSVLPTGGYNSGPPGNMRRVTSSSAAPVQTPKRSSPIGAGVVRTTAGQDTGLRPSVSVGGAAPVPHPAV